jgi:NADH-quinone oxidoreductase subunit M
VNLHLVLAAPLVAAFLTFFLSGRDAASTLRTALVLALAVAAATFPVLSAGTVTTSVHTWFQLPVVGTNIRWGLASDGLSGWLLVLTSVLVPAALLSAPAIVGEKIREFAAAVFLLQTALYGALLSVDLFQFYVFFEAMLIPATILIALFGGRERRRAASMFLIFSLAGSAPLFVAIWYLATAPATMGVHVSLDFVSLQRIVAGLSPQVRMRLFAAVGLAFLVKLPAVPVHIWQADAYSEGPAPGSALLTGVMAKIGLYGFLRIAIPLFPVESAASANVFIFLGIATVLVGALLALRQREARRVLAFSSLSHLGLGLAAIFTFRPEAISGVILLMVAHGLSAAALFFLVGIAETWSRSRHVDDFGALARRAPLFAVLFAVAALASVGLPGTAGFVAELLLIVSLWKSCGIVVAAIAGTTVILSAAYTLRLVQKLLFGTCAEKDPAPAVFPAAAAWAVVPLLLALIYYGFLPGSILRAARADLLTRLPSAQALIVEDAPHVAGR